MNKQLFDRAWTFRFQASPHSSEPQPPAVVIDLPHDYSIIQARDPHSRSGAPGGFFPGGVAVYEKKLLVPAEWKGRVVLLEFEGVYMNAAVRVNNHLVGQHPYGYTSFHCDITAYLRYGGENKISVTVNNSALPNSRWYSGSGIYRHVWLLTAGEVHIAPWGVAVTTPEVSPAASTVAIKTTVNNAGATCTTIVVRSVLSDATGTVVATAETDLTVPASSRAVAESTLHVSPAQLWSVDTPYLYKLRSEVVQDGRVIDSEQTSVGIRSISFDATSGFKLNGVHMKLKGGCVHHDCGLLGAASYDRAEERKVELLKANGFNAVRCAHNPPSPAFLDACDRLGMLVIDEAFDCWREGKNPNDYSVYFADWWERDLAAMILRDRNHPSVIMWSTGNEIIERDGRSDGYKWAQRLADFVRSLDNTRAVTNAICGIWGDPTESLLTFNTAQVPADYDFWYELTKDFAAPLDVVGYNYLRQRYETSGKLFPNRIICGEESFPKDAFDYWEDTERLPYVIGDFVWTALDYLGEAGIGHVWYNGKKSALGDYPWHLANCGDIDICGFKRPQSYYRDCVWGIAEAPYIAVHKPEHYGKQANMSSWGWPDVVASWTWPGFEGKPTTVDVYCRNSEVELLLNGKSLGRKPAGKAERYIASFTVEYEPGELTAIGYENGVEHSRTVLRTAGAPASIRLTPDRNQLKPEFGDLAYVTVEILDAQGNVVHNAENEIYFAAHGVGKLIAVGNSNPVSEEMYLGNRRKAYEGRAMAVLRADGVPGDITLTAIAEGLPPATVVVRV